MKRLVDYLGSTLLLCCSIGPVLAQPSLSKRVCEAAASFFSEHGTELLDRSLAVGGQLTRGQWAVLPSGFGPVGVPVAASVRNVYFAYFLNRQSGAGAVSARIAVKQADTEKPTNEVALYRPTIRRGSNRCEPRGRAEIDRRVRLNQYIDYHDPNTARLNSDLEDFHFRYPQGDASCAATNDPDVVQLFRFPDVPRTEGDTFISRNFSFIGTAYAVGHTYSVLRSELHYEPASKGALSCIGFVIPLNASPQASLTITELGFDQSFRPLPATWLIHR